METGAAIERGRIIKATERGYIVASNDRNGIETPPIHTIDEAEYAIGTMVYFFVFHDGTGLILCQA